MPDTKKPIVPNTHNSILINFKNPLIFSVIIIDFSIICGHRTKEKQNSLYPKFTRVKWPNSKHNSLPSKAVDLVPYINGKISWNKLHCCILAGIVLTCAKNLDIKIRWGGNWDMDSEPITDQYFQDLVHYEEA